MNVQDILEMLKDRSKEDVSRIIQAFQFAENAHRGHKRFSGEPYFVHPYHTAKTLAELQLDTNTIIAGLLHDVCEDGVATTKEIENIFGKDVSNLVHGATKLGKLRYQGTERYLENMRKMFLSMAEDIRVVLIKLADRLHNIETLRYIPEHKRKRIADETLTIYAPLADRLGMGKWKTKLETLAFPFSLPQEYAALQARIKDKLKKKEIYIAKVKYKISEELKKEGVTGNTISSRVKNVYSLHKKLGKHGDNLDEVYDLVALRIIVSTIEECYAALGIIHKLWKPLPGRIKDYIALPKPNGYQSLHTTVFCMQGEITEFQIRTEEMHREAENGIAAHWIYTETGKQRGSEKMEKKLAWISQLREWQKEAKGTQEFFENLKIDLFKDRIFAFTPKGDVINLPESATPIDFAYHVHSEIGNRCNGAKINGKMVSLDSHLANGDMCEIIIQKNKKPSRSWLDFVKTNYAKSRIKASLK